MPENEWQQASLSSYDQIISLSMSLERTDQAERYLNKGKAAWGPQLMAPLEIMVHLRAERVAQAQQAYLVCQQSTSKGLLAQCENAIGMYKPQQPKFDPLKQLGIPSMGQLTGS
ncbi:hypothetical protein D9M70_576830 [compost metagenome]